MLENQAFAAGDEVLIRFRLFADALAHGWGWAIDNLSIQAPVTGVEESPDTAFKLYPVPASSEVFAQFETRSGQTAEFRVSDVQGRVVYSEKVNNLPGGIYQKRIPVQSLAEGVYILKTSVGNKILARKFMKVNR